VLFEAKGALESGEFVGTRASIVSCTYSVVTVGAAGTVISVGIRRICFAILTLPPIAYHAGYEKDRQDERSDDGW
jgi:hypothetical protein